MTDIIIALSILLLALMGVLQLSTAANRAYRDYQKLSAIYRRKMYDARRNDEWIKKQTEFTWPIWPRPILFAAVDHNTQLTLGRADYAIQALESKFASIEAVAPLHLDGRAIFDIFGNLRRIRTQAENRKRLEGFDVFYQMLEGAKITIHKNQNEIVLIKKSIRESVTRLSEDFKASDLNIQFFYNLGAARYEDAIRDIEITQDCLNHAELEMHEAERADLVEWVAAYIFSSIGSLSFDIFNLKGKSFAYSEAYEADLVLSKLSELSDELKTRLDYGQFHDWNQLVLIKNELESFEKEFEGADDLLADFDEKVQKFRALVNQLAHINIEDLSQQAVKAQSELEAYLGAPGESEDWEKIRRGYEPPALLLKKKELQFTKEIEPAFQGMVIKQSEIPALIDSVMEFLAGMKKIQSLIHHLEIWARENDRCERETKQLLSSGGEVEQLVGNIAAFSKDSTPAIMQSCSLIQQDFNIYLERAFGPRQNAHFIALLKDVTGLRVDCETVIAQHEAAIETLQVDAFNSLRSLNQLHQRLLAYQQKKPVIADIDWAQISQEFNQLTQQYAERGSAYSDILSLIKRIKAYSVDENRLIRHCEQQFTAYQTIYNSLNKQISSAQSETDKDIADLQTSWNKALYQFILLLRAYQNQYRKSAAQLQTLQAELTMEEAKGYLEEVDQNVALLDSERREILQQAFGFKEELDYLKKYVLSLKNRKLTETNIAALTAANRNILYAENTDDPIKAIEFLNEATRLLENAHLYTPPVSAPRTYAEPHKIENQGPSAIRREVRQVNRLVAKEREYRKGRQR